MSADVIKEIDEMVKVSTELFKDGPIWDIWCHECGKETLEVCYNYYGMKCQSCGSYNTKPIKKGKN